jgi:hypothetical protein
MLPFGGNENVSLRTLPDVGFTTKGLEASNQEAGIFNSPKPVSLTPLDFPQGSPITLTSAAEAPDIIISSQAKTPIQIKTSPYLSTTNTILTNPANSTLMASELPISLQLPGGEKLWALEIEGLSIIARDLMLRELGTPPHIVLDRMCLQSNLRHFMLPKASKVLGNGDIVGAIHRSMTKMVNLLIVNGSAAIFRRGSLLIIVYPTLELMSGYSFLGRSNQPQSQCQLSIQVREVAADKLKVHEQASRDNLRNIDHLFRSKFDISKKVFFVWGDEPEGLAKNVFIMIGEGRLAELEMMSRYFREIGARVWTSVHKGAWESFRAEKSGAIVVYLYAARGICVC